MYFKKADLILYGVIAMLTVLAISLMGSGGSHYRPGTVTVKQDGSTRIFDLSQDGIFDIGTHTLIIKERTACVTHATCPLKICEKQGALSRGVIACVPNRVIIIVTPEDGDDMDVILR